MRWMICLLLWACPAAAWEFSPTPLCTISHDEEHGSVEITYDPRLSEYAITVTGADNWRAAPIFAIRFEGGSALTISTDRQHLDGRALTVRDTGFGNVLQGLSENTTATALLGPQSLSVSLDGAAEAVAKFKGCVAAPSV